MPFEGSLGSIWKLVEVPAVLCSSQGNTDEEFEILVRFSKTWGLQGGFWSGACILVTSA